jgi:hypothetical protein
MERRKFNLELLINKIKEDNAVLVGDYSGKLTRNNEISYICSCNKECIKNFYTAINESGGFKCSDCVHFNRYGKIKQQKIKLTKEEIKNKIKETNLKKYGTEYGFQSEIVKQKIKEKCLEKYGVEYSLQSKEVKDKGKETNLKKYGTEFGSQSKIIKEKIKNTNLEKYGSDCVFKVPEIKEKIKSTFIKKYGVEHPVYLPETKEKMKKTSLEKYGVEYPTQLVEIQEKAANTAKSYKNYTTPSGKIIKVQGFEPYALDELYKLYSEDDIITDRKHVPKIEYIDNNIKRFYFPDIFIKSINKIIEVKSTWTYKTNEKKCMLKGKSCIDKEFNFELWIYDKKGKNKNVITNFTI